MIDYKKPSKEKANEAFLLKMGIEKKANPYEEEEIDQNKLFLIICEGENTEPSYFSAFPVPTNKIIIKGGCNSKTSLVNYALKEQEKEEYAGREIWCVFDYDIKPDEADTQPQDFNAAILKAEQNGLKVAWSNDAFELWFVLHYQNLETPLTRKELYSILKKEWKLKSFSTVAKTKKYCEEHYSRIGDINSESQKLALKRAKALHSIFKKRKDYSEHCPCTTVYLLIKELNKYLKP